MLNLLIKLSVICCFLLPCTFASHVKSGSRKGVKKVHSRSNGLVEAMPRFSLEYLRPFIESTPKPPTRQPVYIKVTQKPYLNYDPYYPPPLDWLYWHPQPEKYWYPLPPPPLPPQGDPLVYYPNGFGYQKPLKPVKPVIAIKPVENIAGLSDVETPVTAVAAETMDTVATESITPATSPIENEEFPSGTVASTNQNVPDTEMVITKIGTPKPVASLPEAETTLAATQNVVNDESVEPSTGPLDVSDLVSVVGQKPIALFNIPVDTPGFQDTLIHYYYRKPSETLSSPANNNLFRNRRVSSQNVKLKKNNLGEDAKKKYYL